MLLLLSGRNLIIVDWGKNVVVVAVLLIAVAVAAAVVAFTNLMSTASQPGSKQESKQAMTNTP